VIGRRPGRVLLVAAAVLAVLLVGGRWFAVETAERAWAGTLSGGSAAGGVYLQARTLQHLLRVAVWLVATLWGTGNLYIVYRAIGSVQMPRRVGNLEIVEAVPQRLLLALAVVTGIIFGVGLAWGAGDWWREAVLSAGTPHFGRVDPILGRDLGYYLGALPWAVDRQQFLMLATLTAAVLATFLYAGIGSLRWQRGRLQTSPHARVHVGILLAGVALAIVWGALLDPAEVVAGLHGDVDGGQVAARIPGAPAVVVTGGIAALASLVWAGWDRVRWLTVGWGLAVVSMLAVYWVLPEIVRGDRTDRYAAERAELTALAFGTARRTLTTPPGYPTMAAFVAAQSLWSPSRAAAAARPQLGEHEVVTGAMLGRDQDGEPQWIVARAPDDPSLPTLQPPPTWQQVHRGDWTTAGGPVALEESDSGLVPVPLNPPDPLARFGEGFTQYAVIGQDDPAAPGGIPLRGAWRRIALAWVLQSPEIERATAPADRLLWRRTATERLARLAPFARFDPPHPVYVDGSLWWCATGYVSSQTFPLVEAVAPAGQPDGPVRYLRAGFVGAVRASTGETRIWRTPGGDSLSAAWARLFAPLVAPAESLPPALIRTMRFPPANFALAVQQVLAAAPDSEGWTTVAREPYELALPGDRVWWLAQGFASGAGRARGARFEGFLLGRFGASGPELWSVAPPALEAPPPPLVGSGDTIPGRMRLWLAAGRLASVQARFVQQAHQPPRLERVFVTWGNRGGEGADAALALRDLSEAGPPGTADTSMAGRWAAARRLLTRLDSALAVGDLERFGQLYRQLHELLRNPRGPR
jgi:hypothetical protein